MNTQQPTDEQVFEDIPKFTASGGPVTKLMRWAFQMWVVCFLFMLVFTLLVYLAEKFQGG